MGRTFIGIVGAMLLAAASASATRAQTWPSKPIHIVVPFSPGGAIDVFGRLLASRMQDNLKVPVVVDNKPGVGGNLGAEYVARAPADGYTILYNTNGQAISPAMYKTLSWDPFNDFAPVTQLFSTNLLLAASPKLAARDLREFIALAKARPDALNYGSSGVGNPLHLTMELLKLRAGIDVQMVPYKSDGEIINALIGGSVEVAIVPVVTGKPQVLSSVLRGLGVTAARRARGLDVPSISEQGVAGFDAGGWQGLFVAAKTPPEIVERIYVEARKIMSSPDMAPQLETFAVDPVFSGPAEFARFYRAEVESFKQIVREAKIPLQD